MAGVSREQLGTGGAVTGANEFEAGNTDVAPDDPLGQTPDCSFDDANLTGAEIYLVEGRPSFVGSTLTSTQFVKAELD